MFTAGGTWRRYESPTTSLDADRPKRLGGRVKADPVSWKEEMTKLFIKLAEKLNPIARPLGVVMILLFVLPFIGIIPKEFSKIEFHSMTLAFWFWGLWSIWFYYFPRRKEMVNGEYRPTSNYENSHPTFRKIYCGWFVFWFLFVLYFTIVTL
ncbi:MAG: hypothetical protein PHH28_06240 [Desulfuromonadaceae bacterium]|nr:hypothetical protein [Desulfuromonadaceae bacterium]